MQHRGSTPGFGPVYSSASRALILGSYPSPHSFQHGFYYGHPQNRFWPLLAALAGREVPESVEDKTTLILSSHLALWDVLERCDIVGAGDASIRNPIPNDIPALLGQTGIEAVFCNGATAHRFYRRFFEASGCLPATKLPSTSPANAAWSFARLQEAWQPLCVYMPSSGGLL